MSDFIGARISLISKSDIRYSGVLHEINSEESTVSLENVLSFGTEGRKTQQGKADEEVPPADQVYEYIVFRGSDVKDLRIEETPAAKENKPPAIPNDPAIVNARTRPAANAPPGGPPFPPGAPGMPMPPGPGFGPGPGPNMFMGPHPGWAPPPGPPGRGQFQYPPPMPGPGWFPPGQGFPPGGPGGPGPWSNNFPPNGPGGPGGPNGPQGPGARQQPPKTPDTKPSPIGGAQAKATATSSNDAPQGPKVPGQAGAPATAAAPVPPVASKPSVEEVKATAASLTANAKNASIGFGAAPTGPRAAHITPAVPLPAALTQKAAQPAVAQQPADQGPANAAALRDATQAAKAAVAVAMANLERSAAGLPPQAQQSNGNAMDNLTRKVNEMRVNANRPNNYSNRGGRGGRGGGRVGKIDVPDADFDFESSNAKFDKEALLKEAIAGSPLADAPDVDPTDVHDTSAANPPPAYNKTKSFFDNISSEAKDRADNSQKPGGREWRGEEQRKNIETFGQGSVDGGHRGYRGRGRGRGGGRGRGYNQGRGGRGNFRRNEGQPAMQ